MPDMSFPKGTRTPAEPIRFEVHSKHNVPIVDLHGQLDAFAGDALDAAYKEARCEESHAILINFSKVEYFNSTGIALIIGLIMQAAKTGCRLLGYGLSKHYQKIFQMTRLSDYIRLYQDEATALASVQSEGFQI